MDIINNRRSVRNFQPKPVEKEKVELLLKAAMQAPSAINQQPWVFLVIEDKKTLEKLSQLSSPLKTSPLVIVLLTDKRDLKSPQLYPCDMGAATENLLLEAANLGLGGCWVGLLNREVRAEKVIELCNIPDYLEPYSLLALGYPVNEDANHFIDRYNPSKVFYERF